MPRTSPSVELIATQRTWLSPTCSADLGVTSMPLAGVLDADGVEQAGQLVGLEGHVYRRPDHLHDSSDVHRTLRSGRAISMSPGAASRDAPAA